MHSLLVRTTCCCWEPLLVLKTGPSTGNAGATVAAVSSSVCALHTVANTHLLPRGLATSACSLVYSTPSKPSFHICYKEGFHLIRLTSSTEFSSTSQRFNAAMHCCSTQPTGCRKAELADECACVFAASHTMPLLPASQIWCCRSSGLVPQMQPAAHPCPMQDAWLTCWRVIRSCSCMDPAASKE